MKLVILALLGLNLFGQSQVQQVLVAAQTAAGGGGTITFISANSAHGGSDSSSIAITNSVASTAGALMIVAAGFRNPCSFGTMTITDTMGDNGNFVSAQSAYNNASLTCVQIWYVVSAAGGTGTLTVTNSGGSGTRHLGIVKLEFSNALGTLDSGTGAIKQAFNNSNGHVSSTYSTTLVNGEVSVAATFSYTADTTFADWANSPFTIVSAAFDSFNGSLTLGYTIQTSLQSGAAFTGSAAGSNITSMIVNSLK